MHKQVFILLCLLGCLFSAVHAYSGGGYSSSSGGGGGSTSGGSSGGGSTSGGSSGGSSGGGSTSGGGSCPPATWNNCKTRLEECSIPCAVSEIDWPICAACLGSSIDLCCPCLPSVLQKYCPTLQKTIGTTESVQYCSLNTTRTDIFGEKRVFETVVVSDARAFDCAANGGVVSDEENVTCVHLEYGNYALTVLSDQCNYSSYTATLHSDAVSLLTIHDAHGGPLTAVKFGAILSCMGNQAGVDFMFDTSKSILVDLTPANSDPAHIGTVTLTYHAGTVDECQIALQTNNNKHYALPTAPDSVCAQHCSDGSRCSISCPRARCSCLGGYGHQAWCSC